MANQTTKRMSVLPRRIVAIATLYTPYLYNELMRKVSWIVEIRLHRCDKNKNWIMVREWKVKRRQESVAVAAVVIFIF